MRKKSYILITIAVLFIIPRNLFSRETPDVTLKRNPHHQDVLTGEFSVSVSSETAWKVLTDYDHMSDFVSSVKLSWPLESKGSEKKIEQRMVGQAGLFHKHIAITLLVKEFPFHRIEFEDIGKKSFKFYQGSWGIHSTTTSVHIRYELTAQPAFFAPGFLSRGAFRKSVETLLMEVRTEMIQREKAQR